MVFTLFLCFFLHLRNNRDRCNGLGWISWSAVKNILVLLTFANIEIEIFLRLSIVSFQPAWFEHCKCNHHDACVGRVMCKMPLYDTKNTNASLALLQVTWIVHLFNIYNDQQLCLWPCFVAETRSSWNTSLMSETSWRARSRSCSESDSITHTEYCWGFLPEMERYLTVLR